MYLKALVLTILSLPHSLTEGALKLNINNPDSIRTAAATAAYSLQSIYNGNRTGGVLGKFPFPPFYWWESGAAWDGMVQYWHYTGDESYYNITHDALVSQISVTNNYLPTSEKFDEGNDDVAFWTFGAMSAVEYGFRKPPAPYPSWLAICDNVFNDYIRRWNSSTCNGGLSWQIFPSSAGYTYKNSISNGGFFQLAARLARYTNNQTYYDWAEKVWNWSIAVGFIDSKYAVFDGGDESANCTDIHRTQFSYNVAVFLFGAAVLHNFTGGNNIWTNRTSGLLDATSNFLSPFKNATNVMYEQACETTVSCNVDQYSFKAYVARWLAGTSMMAPYTASRVGTILRASAPAAVAACKGTTSHNVICGARWYLGKWDGTSGLGQSLSVMEVVYALLVNETAPPAMGYNKTLLTTPSPTEAAGVRGCCGP